MSTEAGAPLRRSLSLQDFLPYRLSVATNLVSEVIASAYQALFGLRIPEWRLIAVLAEQEGLNQQGVGEATRMDKVAVSRTAAALIQRGLIRREVSLEDGRAHRLSLTRAGRALYAQVAPKALELEARIAGELSASERQQFLQTLERLERRALQIGAAERNNTGASET